MVALDLNLDTVRTGLWCTAALALNQFTIQMGQGGSKFPAGERPPEDSMLSLAKSAKKKSGVEQTMGFKQDTSSPAMQAAREKVERWSRIGDNWLENAPLGLIVAWASMLTASNHAYFPYFFIAFVANRWLHTITYALKLQPWRALAWLGSWVSVIGMLTLGIRA
eukprot:TRINITY_DN6360_c0_g1_i1.p2 TRINITY_DN6360_c0_g1~~TRINITY_DN6360_c0_g1_i1.p2  ORF type:complete len:181 (+),score=68.20 TRINITY_DN6360_c0_g1_i1:50-544(+)